MTSYQATFAKRLVIYDEALCCVRYAALVMYRVPASADERPGCRDTLIIIRAVFGVVLPPLMGMFAILVLMALAVVAFSVTPLLALMPIGAIVGGIVLYARWERGRSDGGGPHDF